MAQGIIMKALSGFYYVDDGIHTITCRGRGKLRYENTPPLVGDQVRFTPLTDGSGALEEILPRKNQFYRPAVANIDQMIIMASEAILITDPFLIDRVVAIAQNKGCESVICINKCDLVCGERLAQIYRRAGFTTLQLSAKTGEGIQALQAILTGKVSSFTGNSGVGKSSILNALDPSFSLATGEVSQKQGRGKHTTRHVELFRLACGGVVADTPGFSSFDVDRMELCQRQALPHCFQEFAPYLDQCRFLDCAHVKEQGCAVLRAVSEGEIMPTRHRSYVRLYEQLKQTPDWKKFKK